MRCWCQRWRLDGARGLIGWGWNGDASQPLSLTKRIGKGLPFANLAQASALQVCQQSHAPAAAIRSIQYGVE